MKKFKSFLHRIANADPMIWGYVMLNPTIGNKQQAKK